MVLGNNWFTRKLIEIAIPMVLKFLFGEFAKLLKDEKPKKAIDNMRRKERMSPDDFEWILEMERGGPR